MADKRINLCRVLLSVILCAVFVSVNTAESYARYENSFSFKTVLVPGESSPVESDLLALSTDAPQTVIVGEISSAEKTKTVSFVLKSLGDSAKGTFSLTNEHGNYINVSASTDSSVLEHGTELEVPAEGSKTVTLTFTANETAFNMPHEELDIEVAVSWGEMSGKFLITIPEVKASEPENGEITGDSSEGNQNVELNSPENQESSSGTEQPEEGTEQKNDENGIMSIGIFDAIA